MSFIDLSFDEDEIEYAELMSATLNKKEKRESISLDLTDRGIGESSSSSSSSSYSGLLDSIIVFFIISMPLSSNLSL